MADAINVGAIIADLDIDSSHLERGLAQARVAMDAVSREVQRLQTELKAGNITTQDASARVAALTATYQQLQGAMRAAYSANTQLGSGLGVVNASAEGAAGRMKGLTFASLQASRAFQDVSQAGLAAGLNNVEGIAYGAAKAFGATTAAATGFSGIAQGLAVVAYLVSENWGRMTDAMGVGIPAPAISGLKAVQAELKETVKAIDEAYKKTRMTAGEREKFDADRTKAAALEKVQNEEKTVAAMEGPTREDRERGSNFEEGVRAQGGPAQARELLEAQFSKKAEAEGQLLGDFDLRKKAKDAAGVNLANEGTISRGDIETLSASLGIKLDSEEMQFQKDNHGKSLESQVMAALRKQKFLGDAESNDFATPGEMARRTMTRGAKGDKGAADVTGRMLDDEAGDPTRGLRSAFTKGFHAKDEAEAAEDAEKDLEDSNKAWADYSKKRDKWVADQAKELAKGDRGLDALTGTLSTGVVRESMVLAGVDRGRADRTAGAVKAKLERDAKEKVRDHAEANGQSAEEARLELFGQGNDQRRDAQEQKKKKAAGDAERDLPGIGDLAKRLTLSAAVAGDNPEVVKQQIAEALKQRGLDGAKADLAAEGLASDAGTDLRKKVADQMNNPDDADGGASAREKRKVEQFSAEGLAAKIQASVGGNDDPAHKQVDLQTQMVKYLADMAAKGQWTPKFK